MKRAPDRGSGLPGRPLRHRLGLRQLDALPEQSATAVVTLALLGANRGCTLQLHLRSGRAGPYRRERRIAVEIELRQGLELGRIKRRGGAHECLTRLEKGASERRATADVFQEELAQEISHPVTLEIAVGDRRASDEAIAAVVEIDLADAQSRPRGRNRHP